MTNLLLAVYKTAKNHPSCSLQLGGWKIYQLKRFLMLHLKTVWVAKQLCHKTELSLLEYEAF